MLLLNNSFDLFKQSVSALLYLLYHLGGHGRLQPADLAHRHNQFLHLPVALPQLEPLVVMQDQPRLPETQPQAAN